MHEGEKSIGLGSFGDKLGLQCHCGHLSSPSTQLGIYHSVAIDDGSLSPTRSGVTGPDVKREEFPSRCSAAAWRASEQESLLKS